MKSALRHVYPYCRRYYGTGSAHVSLDEFQGLAASCGLPLEKFFSVPRIVPNLPNKIGIAFSGGADSTSLAILLSKYTQKLYQDEAFAVDIVALTVDHDLRDESTEEAQTVSEFLASMFSF